MWAAEKARVRSQLLILFPLMGTHENAVVMYHFRPHMGPREGRGDVATADFAPVRSTSALMWAPE